MKISRQHSKIIVIASITLFVIFFATTNNAMQNQEAFFKNAKIEDIKQEEPVITEKEIINSYNLTCGDFKANLDLSLNKKTKEITTLFLYSKFDHKNDPFAHNIEILEEFSHPGMYKAKMLLFQYLYKSDFWGKNNLDKNKFNIKKIIKNLKTAIIEPLKITDMAHKKYSDTRIICVN